MSGQHELWADLLAPAERERLTRGRFGRRVGFGRRAAILVIDAQRYMVGRAPDEPAGSEPPGGFPSACGPGAHHALGRIAELLAIARPRGVDVVYTRMELRRDGRDAGVIGRKRDLLAIDGWMLEGTPGADIVPEVAPQPDDIVLVKKKPSAFFGTPLACLLLDRGVDTLIVTGGSTSNCVRATVADAYSNNFHVLVPRDCVFDRIDVSHRVALFDIDRLYGDVVDSGHVTEHLIHTPDGGNRWTSA
ncbi:isochorismatase family protein [Pseudonocardia thermophila]|uniref:isochorismatase family protein n=1 Tax=Pseudonocardia thermophila TaxID=1848 RepID=UPI00248E336F|nr:isochorismatase family protein [Pseudonocardia thermophila]